MGIYCLLVILNHFCNNEATLEVLKCFRGDLDLHRVVTSCFLHPHSLLGNVGHRYSASCQKSLICQDPGLSTNVLVFALLTDLLFPIDIALVKREHDFLDRDAIEALCR